ncbi:MAG: hypothetical protein ACTIC1_05745 [Brevibacterium sp.]
MRTKDRETITLTNFSFAEGEVTLVHPLNVPFQTLEKLLNTTEGLEEYVEFSCSEGVTSPEDFVFLVEMATPEAFEFAGKLEPYLKRGSSTAATAGGDSAPQILSEADEAILAEFVQKMNATPDATDPFASDDEDEDGDDGLAFCLTTRC